MMSESPWLTSRLAAGAAALLAGVTLAGAMPATPVAVAWADPVASTVTPQAGTVTVSLTGSYDPDQAQRLLTDLNTVRAQTSTAEKPVEALAWSPSLEALAQQRAAEYALGFEAPLNSSVAPVAEDLGRGADVATAIASWKSAGTAEYAHLCDPAVSAVGIAAFTVNGTVYVVAEFGNPGDSATPLQGEQVVSVAVPTSYLGVYVDGSGLNNLQPGGAAQLSATYTYNNLPVSVGGTWSSSDSAVASIDGAGTIAANAAGAATMTLSSTDGLTLASVPVTVVAPTPLEATIDSPEVTTPYGEAPQLPEMATVTYSDGTFDPNVPVVWDPIDETEYHEGDSTFTANGTADGLPVSANVYVDAPSVVSVADPAPITIEQGETPELPAKVTATLEDGATEQLPVTWNLSADGETEPWDTEEPSVDIEGVPEGTDLTVTQLINITPKNAVADGTDSAAKDDAATDDAEKPATNGADAPTNPDDPDAKPDDDDAANASATPDGADAATPDGATTSDGTSTDGADSSADDANGGVDTDKPSDKNPSDDATDSANPTNPDASDSTTDTTDPADSDEATNPSDGDASKDPADTDTPADDADDPAALPEVASIENPPTFYALASENYQEIKLPTAIKATLPDGTEGTVDVTWKLPDDPTPTAKGTLTATAEVNVVGAEGTDPTTKQVEQTIQLVTVAQNAIALTVEQGADPELPATVAMTYEETTVNVPVTWDTVAKDATAEPGEFAVEGTVNGTVGSVTATVTVEKTAATITAVKDPEPVTTVVGTAPVLPETVEVTYSDETTGKVAVTWAEIPAERYAAPGSFLVEGTIADSDLTASLKVTVVEASATIKSVETPTVETPAGTAPVLPETVKVTWDNDTTSDVKVTWAAINADQYAKPGSFTVSGTLADLEDAKATCTVTVLNVPVSVAALPDVTTDAGIAPALPATVNVTYADGTVKSLAVTWNAIDPASYHNQGSFVVDGTVADTNLTAQVKVVVAAPKVAAIQNNLAVQTNVGVAPKLPATASVRWSNGDTTNEPVTWTQPSASQYAKAGTFTVSGTVVGYNVSCSVTVVQPAPQVVATGDTTSMVPIIVGAVAGVAIIAAAVALIVRGRKK